MSLGMMGHRGCWGCSAAVGYKGRATRASSKVGPSYAEQLLRGNAAHVHQGELLCVHHTRWTSHQIHRNSRWQRQQGAGGLLVGATT